LELSEIEATGTKRFAWGIHKSTNMRSVAPKVERLLASETPICKVVG
jgi:hypothetical protein